jgi:hypothetical protein
MRSEVERDLVAGSLRLSHLLSPAGLEHYPDLLLETMDRGTSTTLAAALRAQGCLDPTRVAAGDAGEIAWEATAIRLARREFRRFYARGLCARAVAAGVALVEVYRARAARQTRDPDAAAALIGHRLDVHDVLEALRGGDTLDGVLGLPSGGCSGLSVRPTRYP